MMNSAHAPHEKRAKTLIEDLIETLIRPPNSNASRRWSYLWYVALYGLGILVWSMFLDFGRLDFDLHDWTQEGARYAFLRQALLENRLPLHIGSDLAATDRFLAIPDTLISPQFLLLRCLQPGAFVLVNTLFLYSLGVLGLHLIRRKLHWSPLTFGVVFIIFSFNGHLTAHIAVGHSMWASGFLLPYFILLLLNLVEGAMGWGWIACVAVLQLSIFLQGGFHFFLWNLLFLLLVGLWNRRYFGAIIKAILFSVLINMLRILPAAIQYSTVDNPFISGYFSLADMLAALLWLKPPALAQTGAYTSLGWWEVDCYLGVVGFGFWLYFGCYRSLDRHKSVSQPASKLLAPSLSMAFLSLGKMYQPISMIPLPLMDAERVSSRFLILPVMVILILAGIQFERWLRDQARPSRGKILAFIAGLAVLAHDLLQHTRLWRVERMDTLFQRTPVDIRSEVLTIIDPPYHYSLILGLSISLITLAFLCYKVLAARRYHDQQS